MTFSWVYFPNFYDNGFDYLYSHVLSNNVIQFEQKDNPLLITEKNASLLIHRYKLRRYNIFLPYPLFGIYYLLQGGNATCII